MKQEDRKTQLKKINLRSLDIKEGDKKSMNLINKKKSKHFSNYSPLREHKT